MCQVVDLYSRGLGGPWSVCGFVRNAGLNLNRVNHAFALIALAISLCSAAPALAQVDCQAPSIIAPAMYQTVSDLRPAIRWAAVPGASSYRLVLTARKPEGGVIALIDTSVIGTGFVPPAALADSTAEVRLSIVATCDAIPSSSAQPGLPHRFYIDLRPTCRLPELPEVRAGQSGQGQRQLHWTRAVNADRCEVLGYAAFDGRLLLMHETRELRLDLPDQAGGVMAIVVRPRCGPVVGTPAYLLD